MPQGKWNMGRVIDTFPDKNNAVRQALIKTATSELRRPISKLCHIMTPLIMMMQRSIRLRVRSE